MISRLSSRFLAELLISTLCIQQMCNVGIFAYFLSHSKSDFAKITDCLSLQLLFYQESPKSQAELLCLHFGNATTLRNFPGPNLEEVNI